MAELMLPTSRSTPDIPVMFDVIDVEIPPWIELDVLDGNNLPVDNVTSHLWNRITIIKDQLKFENMRKIKLMKKTDNLYIQLSTLTKLFYTVAQQRKLHKEFARPSKSKLYDLLKKA